MPGGFPPSPGATGPMQALMIGLGNEIFAIETDMVREIIDPVPLTRVAGARPHLPGLINVRGNVIPLADLRERFGMPRHQAGPDTRIVVIEVEIDDDPVTLGIIADKVYEVTELSRDETIENGAEHAFHHQSKACDIVRSHHRAVDRGRRHRL
jgi:purine-binding chemotaxis protein CheW